MKIDKNKEYIIKGYGPPFNELKCKVISVDGDVVTVLVPHPPFSPREVQLYSNELEEVCG